MKICFKKVGVGTDVTGDATHAAIHALDSAGEDCLVLSAHAFYEAAAACRQELISATVYCPKPDLVDLEALKTHIGCQSVRVTLGGALEEVKEPPVYEGDIMVAVAVATVQVDAALHKAGKL